MKTVVGISLKINGEYELFAEAPLADFGNTSTWTSTFGDVADYGEIFERTLERLRVTLFDMHKNGALGRVLEELECDAYICDEATHTLFEAEILGALTTADISVLCN